MIDRLCTFYMLLYVLFVYVPKSLNVIIAKQAKRRLIHRPILQYIIHTHKSISYLF